MLLFFNWSHRKKFLLLPPPPPTTESGRLHEITEHFCYYPPSPNRIWSASGEVPGDIGLVAPQTKILATPLEDHE